MRRMLELVLVTTAVGCFATASGCLLMVLVLGAVGRVDEAIATGWAAVALWATGAVTVVLENAV